MTERRQIPVVLIGGGPACAAAAVQLARAGIEAVMIAPALGGLVRNAWRVENFPGFPEGIGGADLAERIVRHIAKSGVTILNDTVQCVHGDGDGFAIRMGGGEVLCDHVVVGTGTTAKRLEVKGETQAAANGALAYEIADVIDRIGRKRIVIVGAGDVAYDYALNAAQTAESVTIVQRSDKPRSLAVLQKAAAEKANITVRQQRCVTAVEGRFGDANVKMTGPDGDETMQADAVLAAVGRWARLELLSEELHDAWRQQRGVPGLFVIGDAAHPACRHVAVAMGDGVRCAMDIETRMPQ